MTAVIAFVALALALAVVGTHRCVFCRGPIWPWSRVGWVHSQHDEWSYWHPDCYEMEHEWHPEDDDDGR